jgi:adenosine deaminase
VARELIHDWRADGVTYGEVRFAPQLHGERGLGLDDAVRAVADGLATAPRTRVFTMDCCCAACASSRRR